jgi:hypothetical protein
VLNTPGWDVAFDGDGALLDIVVSAMTPQDWDLVLEYFRERPQTWTPCVGKPAKELPGDYLAISHDDPLLARGDLPGQLNAWFLGEELEIDLDPRLVTTDEQVLVLHGFMRELGQLLQRDVTMSWEGSREAVTFRYRLADDSIAL